MIKKYDLFFSLGAACLASDVLRHYNLQKASYPFNWLAGSNFIDRVNILHSEFSRLLEINDLKILTKSDKNDVYENTYNGLVFNHDFALNGNINLEYEAISEKYNRRAKRLLNNIKKAKNVLILYMMLSKTKENLSNEVLLKSLNKLQNKFGKKINLLILKCDLSTNNLSTNVLNKYTTIHTLNYAHAEHSNYNKEAVVQVFNNYRLGNSLHQKIKSRLFK